jgi:hypothetical protein
MIGHVDQISSGYVILAQVVSLGHVNTDQVRSVMSDYILKGQVSS